MIDPIPINSVLKPRKKPKFIRKKKFPKTNDDLMNEKDELLRILKQCKNTVYL